jgi:protein-tyrosine-phosphatase
MQPKLKILILCTGNSCRSQMAEGWARALKSDIIEPYSYSHVRDEIRTFIEQLPQILNMDPQKKGNP